MSHPINRILLVAALGASALLARADIKVGDPFPALEPAGLVNLAGGGLPAIAGQVVLVDFWASWCAPCKASFPAMARLQADFAPRGLLIVAVSIDEKPAAALAFWRKLAPPFTALHDREQKLVQQVVVPTMPTSYLLDRTGKVRFVHEGFHGEASDREIRKEITTLLGEK
jgi:thiol-disulfide isomerase/thioredoxin